MKITVLAFATAAEALGGEPLELEVAEGSKLSELEGILCARFPRLVPLWPRLAVAVDGQLASLETSLSEGMEVALLPPVSGGSDALLPLLSQGPIDCALVEATVRHPSRGAVLVFRGDVRHHHQGRPVDKLTYSAYRPMAEARLGRIVRELEDTGDNLRVAIVHRLGEVAAGETSVVIAVASPHREAAYGASREALERLKKEVPIWKQEHFTDGEATWREVEPLGPGKAELGSEESSRP